MPKLSVADLERGKQDDAGGLIIAFYSRRPPDYAIYRTPDRVVIQYADADRRANDQRKSMAALNPLRGEINGLIDGWRSNRRLRDRIGDLINPGRPQKPSPLQRKAERYDRRVADALILAFENDVASAQQLLVHIKQDLLDERIAHARFEYLATAFAVGALVMWILLNFPFRLPSEALDLLRAAGAGTVGAFFSIALAIRGRTVLPDLQRAGNLMDAVLRVLIGLIAAAVLIGLMTSGAVTLNIGNAQLGSMCDPADAACKMNSKAWIYVLLVGFMAGFSERFVPDLLEKATAGAVTPSGSIPTSAAAAAPAVEAASPDAIEVVEVAEPEPPEAEAEAIDGEAASSEVGTPEPTAPVAPVEVAKSA